MNEELKATCRKLEDRFLLLDSARNARIIKLEELKQAREELMQGLEVRAKAIEFAESISGAERQEVKNRVEDLIASCLKAVFDDSYRVEFEYGVKRSKTAVEVFAIRNCPDGLIVRRGIDGIGGGLADAISLPLKLIVLLNDPELDRIFVIDEPGKHLSLGHVPRFASFLKSISKRLGVQIIMLSHHTCMDAYADSINEIELEGSQSYVERVK